MHVLYGVAGEGLGHAMRSAVVAEYLESRGHDVRFVSSGSAFKYLERRWPGKVVGALGLQTAMVGNTVLPFGTVLANFAKQTVGPIAHLATFVGVSMGGKPNVVISDFEPWTARYASLFNIPLIAVDNIHFLNRCDHPREVISSDRSAAALMYPTVNSMVPNAQQYLVTTFAPATVSRPSTFLYRPILRNLILNAAVSVGNHICVYFNENSDHKNIVEVLNHLPQQFVLYGSRVEQDVFVGNVTLRPFSEQSFIRDLASANAVIGGAGFTLMSECIFLRKPLLAVPFGNHFEQILNANYLQRMGYGERCQYFTPALISAFLASADHYRERLAQYVHDSNRELLQSVENAIVNVCS